MDKECYPENYESIVGEIRNLKKECGEAYLNAIHILHGPGGEEKARPLFSEIAAKFPDTAEGKNALRFLQGRIEKLPQEFGAALMGNKLRLTFDGNALDYFHIWIFNAFLTIVTLGVYSPWAKVQEKQYLFSCISLDKTPLQYHGKAGTILQGRLFACVFLLTFFFLVKFHPPGLPFLYLVGLVAAPLVFVRSIATAVTSLSYKKMKFQFHGTMGKASCILLGWGVIPCLMIGFIFNWWQQLWAGGMIVLFLLLIFPIWLKEIEKYIFTNISMGSVCMKFETTGGEFFRICYMGVVIAFINGLLFSYALASVVQVESEAGRQFFGNLISCLSYLGYLLAIVYIKVNITNAIWNKLKLGSLSFTSSLSTWEMYVIYMTNVLAIVCSCGILIPWAEIRTLRYRIEHTIVHCLDSSSEIKEEKLLW